MGVRPLFICFVCVLFTTLPAQAQDFGRNKVHYDPAGFQTLHTEHFDIYFRPDSSRAALLAAQMAERWYTRLSKLLNHQLSSRQPLVLYASHAAFEQTNVVP